jgi:hypothetical protein
LHGKRALFTGDIKEGAPLARRRSLFPFAPV